MSENMYEEMFREYGTQPEKLPKERIEANKSRVFSLAGIEKSRAKKPRVMLRRAAAIPLAAAISVVCAATVTASATGAFGTLFHSFLGDAEITRDMLRSGIFHDEDGNVSVDVDELISDGMVTLATVRYTALTDEGKAWLDKYEVMNSGENGNIEERDFDIYIQPAAFANGNYTFGGNGYSQWTEELTDLRTENERVFKSDLVLSGNDRAGNEVIFRYPMSADSREKYIDISDRIRERHIVINAEPDSDKIYVPTYLRIAQLSFTLYGNIDSTDGDYFPTPDYTRLEQNTYLVTRDGKRIKSGGASCPVQPSEENNYSSAALLTGSLYDYDDPILSNYIFLAIEPEDVVGIQIEDHYYGFTD